MTDPWPPQNDFLSRAWPKVKAVLRRIGRVVFYLVISLLLTISVFIGIASVIDANEPVIWGTYTEHICTPRPRHGCSSVGTWISDDGQITKFNISLDGYPEGDGTVRAAYVPTGILNDTNNNIVHTSFGVAVGPFVGWGLAVILVGTILGQADKWGHLKIRPRSRARAR